MANYQELLRDSTFWQTIRNTLFYAVLALPLGAIVALGLAMMLNAKIRGLTFYRTIFFLPSLVPQVALSVLWLWIFNGEYGILNHAIGLLHFGGFPILGGHFLAFQVHGPNWLGDENWSKPALVLLGVWGVGNAMVIYLAGLQEVPQALYEAADLDGASWWAKTRHVTIPMLSPVILFNSIMGIIGTLQVFAVPYVMSPTGSPARSIYFYTMYLFDNAFIYQKMGYACAMGWIMFVIILLLTLGAIKLTDRHVHYENS